VESSQPKEGIVPLSQDDKAAFYGQTRKEIGMAVAIRQARRSATKLRLLLEGPSGSGKTFGGLTVAKGLGCKRVIVIDTEQGSSDLYDTILPFDVIDLSPPFTPEKYIEAIEAAEEAGADCIIIDSISHEWNGKGGCLELVDEIARAKFKGNTWSAYSEITPRHRAFIDRMLRSSAHIIATTRSKTETAQVNEGGRTKVVKLGMKAETRDGVEYEFTTCLSLVHDGHFAVAAKDRTGLFSGDPKPITVETGNRIAEWLSGGKAVEDQAVIDGARKAINDATSVDVLDRLNQRIAQRLTEGRISQATATELAAAIADKRNGLNLTTAITA
jgi:hypothetical protein